MLTRTLPRMLKMARDDWGYLSMVFGGTMGAVGGFAYGLMISDNNFRRNIGCSRLERTVERTMLSTAGAMVGGIGGWLGMFTAPVWVPVASTALLYDFFVYKSDAVSADFNNMFKVK